MITRLREIGEGLHVQFFKLGVGLLCVLLLLVTALAFSDEGLMVFSRKPVIFLLVALAYIVGGAAFVAYITKPLRRLTREMNEFSASNLTHDLEIGGITEIDELGRAFNAMTSNVQGKIKKIHKLAYMDSVTQLPNREYFRKELSNSICRAIRNRTSGALLFVDLDGFKRVNDTMGHDLGDKLLRLFSERVTEILRTEDMVGFSTAKSDADAFNQIPGFIPNGSGEKPDDKTLASQQMLARLGGDEFTVLLSQIRVETDAATVAQRIIDAANEPFEIDGTSVSIGASIGIATFPRDGEDYHAVLKNADLAMYKAKEDGKNRFHYFSEKLNLRAQSRLQMESDLRDALKDNDQFILYYQPKFDCREGNPVAVEALLRWNHPEKGMLYPGDFISIAEECGLIGSIFDWVLATTCADLAIFDRYGNELSMAINISPIQMNQPDFAENLLKIVSQSGIDSTRLELEITGSFHLDNMARVQRNFEMLAGQGVQFAVDDFRGGVSGLLDLADLPLHIFKIDDGLVASLENSNNKKSGAIIKSLLVMARSLNLTTVAEGVETAKQLEFLIEHGCDNVQGFYLSRPKPALVLSEWLQAGENHDNARPKVA